MNHTEYMREWRKRPGNAEAQRESNRRYRRKPRSRAIQRAERKSWAARHRDKEREYHKRWEKRNPEKYRAHMMLNIAVQSGQIVRPDHCEDCGLVCTPHGHHENYEKHFEVIWVCPQCHKRRHAHATPARDRRGEGQKKEGE